MCALLLFPHTLPVWAAINNGLRRRMGGRDGDVRRLVLIVFVFERVSFIVFREMTHWKSITTRMFTITVYTMMHFFFLFRQHTSQSDLRKSIGEMGAKTMCMCALNSLFAQMIIDCCCWMTALSCIRFYFTIQVKTLFIEYQLKSRVLVRLGLLVALFHL